MRADTPSPRKKKAGESVALTHPNILKLVCGVQSSVPVQSSDSVRRHCEARCKRTHCIVPDGLLLISGQFRLRGWVLPQVALERDEAELDARAQLEDLVDPLRGSGGSVANDSPDGPQMERRTLFSTFSSEVGWST